MVPFHCNSTFFIGLQYSTFLHFYTNEVCVIKKKKKNTVYLVEYKEVQQITSFVLNVLQYAKTFQVLKSVLIIKYFKINCMYIPQNKCFQSRLLFIIEYTVFYRERVVIVEEQSYLVGDFKYGVGGRCWC